MAEVSRLSRSLIWMIGCCSLCLLLGTRAEAATPWTGYVYADATGGSVDGDGVIENGPRGDSDWDEAAGYYSPYAGAGIHSALLGDIWPPVIGIDGPIAAADTDARVWAGGGVIRLKTKLGNWHGPTENYVAPGGAVYAPPENWGTSNGYGWFNQVHDVTSSVPSLQPGDPVQLRLIIDIEGAFEDWASVRGQAWANAMATVVRVDDYLGYLDSGYDWFKLSHFLDSFGVDDYPNFWCDSCVTPLGQMIFHHDDTLGATVDHNATLTIQARIGDRIVLESAMAIGGMLVNEALDADPALINGQIAGVDLYDGYSFQTQLMSLTPGVEINGVPEPSQGVLAYAALVTLALTCSMTGRWKRA
jgi:hypothetical protein